MRSRGPANRHAICKHTCPSITINFFLAIRRLDDANSVIMCAVFVHRLLCGAMLISASATELFLAKIWQRKHHEKARYLLDSGLFSSDAVLVGGP
jgi:Na+/H+ antiporter NhaA